MKSEDSQLSPDIFKKEYRVVQLPIIYWTEKPTKESLPQYFFKLEINRKHWKYRVSDTNRYKSIVFMAEIYFYYCWNGNLKRIRKLSSFS